MPQRRPAGRPAGRTVDVGVADGAFAGWEATVRADFPARTLIDLQSGDVDRIVRGLGRIIVSHNMPDADGAIASDLADVEPYDGLFAIAKAALAAISSLPPR